MERPDRPSDRLKPLRIEGFRQFGEIFWRAFYRFTNALRQRIRFGNGGPIRTFAGLSRPPGPSR